MREYVATPTGALNNPHLIFHDRRVGLVGRLGLRDMTSSSLGPPFLVDLGSSFLRAQRLHI